MKSVAKPRVPMANRPAKGVYLERELEAVEAAARKVVEDRTRDERHPLRHLTMIGDRFYHLYLGELPVIEPRRRVSKKVRRICRRRVAAARPEMGLLWQGVGA